MFSAWLCWFEEMQAGLTETSRVTSLIIVEKSSIDIFSDIPRAEFRALNSILMFEMPD